MFDAPPFKGVFTAEERNDMLFCQHMEYEALGLNEYIECHILPLFNADGEIVNYFISAFDVTCDRNRDSENHKIEREYRAVKQRISQQHERLKYLLVNSERFLMRSNIRQETISFFRSPETPEYTHSFEQFLNMIVEQDRDSIRSILYDTVTKTPRHSTIHMALPSEGLTGTVFDISFNPILNSEGEVIGHEGISSDITIFDDTCKKLEEETRLAADSVKLKSGFMASMTHELRTPLNAIVGFTGVLEALGDSTERAEYVRIIRNSSDMLQRLINDIIEVSSMTEGSITIKKEKVNFAAAFEDICMTLEQRVQEPEVTFIKENPYESFMTSLDIERIQQVLTNFVANAVKFTREGHIKVGYRYEREGLYLYCEDTGAGIPKEKQKMIFERFVKLDEFVQGTGMGLAICKSIAESSQGEIGVISEGMDKGSTFWVWIPCERLL